MLNQLKQILDKLFRILGARYQPTHLYIKVGFSLPAQVLFFFICANDSAGFIPRRAHKVWAKLGKKSKKTGLGVFFHNGIYILKQEVVVVHTNTSEWKVKTKPSVDVVYHRLTNFTAAKVKGRNRHQWCSVRKSVLRNFTKLTGKHLCWGSLF